MAGRPRAVRLSILLASLAALAAVETARASLVVFDDGLARAIPGAPGFANGDSIRLANASSLTIGIGASVGGAAGLSGSDAVGATAVSITTAGRSDLRGGEIVGGPASALVDETTAALGLAATGGAGIELDGAFGPPYYSLLAASVSLRGGESSAFADDTIAQAVALGGPALRYTNGSAYLYGGEFTGGAATATGANALNVARSGDGVVVAGGKALFIYGGTYRSGVAHATDDLSIHASATSESGAAVRLFEGSKAVIRGGLFESGLSVADAGFASGDATARVGPAIDVDHAGVTLFGGEFRVGAAAASSGPAGTQAFPTAAALRVTSGGASILGGTFRGGRSLEIPYDDAPGNHFVQILGGDLDSPGPEPDLLLANPRVLTIIIGDLESIDGVPFDRRVPLSLQLPPSGTLIGHTSMGGDFEWRYELRNGATIDLPEPIQTLPFGLMGLLFYARSRRRTRQAPCLGR